MLKWREHRKEAAAYINNICQKRPEIGLILGSGLGDFGREIEEAVVIPYQDIPGFPTSTVKGHAGELILGKKQGKSIIVMNGRAHFYEGYSIQEVVFPVWVMKELGIRKLIVTNAAGGLNPTFRPGDLMIITDHLNFIGTNPLIGANDQQIGPRFPAMTDAHPAEYVELAKRAADSIGLHIMKGVYLAISGPVYESTAMSKFQRLIGADAVGMSTVPEIIASTHAGIKNLAISCITDIVKDNPEQSLTHEEVIKVASEVKPRFIKLVNQILKDI